MMFAGSGPIQETCRPHIHTPIHTGTYTRRLVLRRWTHSIGETEAKGAAVEAAEVGGVVRRSGGFDGGAPLHTNSSTLFVILMVYGVYGMYRSWFDRMKGFLHLFLRLYKSPFSALCSSSSFIFLFRLNRLKSRLRLEQAKMANGQFYSTDESDDDDDYHNDHTRYVNRLFDVITPYCYLGIC